METPSQPKDDKPTSSSKPVYQVESTGSYWGDFREAVKVCVSSLVPVLTFAYGRRGYVWHKEENIHQR